MRIQTDKQSLHKGTSRLQGAITERSLAHIGIRSGEQQLILTSADMVLSAFCHISCEVLNPGELFVPAKLFSEVVRELPEGVVHLEVDGAYLNVVAGPGDQFLMKIPLIQDQPWQDPPQMKISDSCHFSCVDLAYMIDQIQFCVLQDSPRNFGTVAYFHRVEKQNWRLVGSDGFRLSYCQAKQTEISEKFLDEGVCLTKRTLGELSKICREGHEKVKISISEDRYTLIAELPDYQVFVRLSAVKYPNYKSVIAQQGKYEVSIDRKTLLEGSRRIMLAADKSKSIRLKFAEGLLEIISRTLGGSEGREKISIQDFDGDVSLSINGKYLMDVVSTSGSERLILKFSNEDSPMMILPVDEPSGCQSLHLFLPIKETSRA